MPEQEKKRSQDDEKPKKNRLPGCLLITAILAVLGFIIKHQVDQAIVRNTTKAYLKEAEAHIEARRFLRAEETLELANEVNPNRREILDMQTDLKEARVINFYEKELTRTLQSKDWDKVRDAITNLRIRDPQHPQIVSAKQEMDDGIHKEKLSLLLSQLSVAQKKGKLADIIDQTNRLLAHDPNNPTATRWQEIKNKAEKEILESEKKASQFYEQAKLVDKGIYSGELYMLASKAKSLSEKKVYKDFYSKVSKYPRIIRYPNEYSNLQDAIDAARPIDTVQIAEGSYHAPIRIDKEIKLVGIQGKTVVLHASGTTSPVLYVTESGKLKAEYIMFKHIDTSEAEEAYSTIVVAGEASLFSSAIYESAGHGVHVINGGKFIANSCRIENNRWDGIAATGTGSFATIQKSVITRNQHNGLDAWDGGKIDLYDSFSENNLQSGAVATNQGSLKIIGSTIRLNSHTGLYLTSGGNAAVKRSELSKNRLAGGYGDQSGDVTIETTKILGNGEAGIVLTKNTSWKGLDSITFADNAGKEVWDNAEFRISDILKDVLSEDDDSTRSDTEQPATDEVPNDTPEEQPETTESEQNPDQVIIIEE